MTLLAISIAVFMLAMIGWSEGHGRPPMWVRHLVPMSFLKWFDDHTAFCWASMCAWKLGYDMEWTQTAGDCNRRGPDDPPQCWCGKYRGDEEAHQRYQKKIDALIDASREESRKAGLL